MSRSYDQKYSLLPPSGLRDFFNQEAQQRRDKIQKIQKVYESFGFYPLETSALESLDILLSGSQGSENEKLIFKVLKRGEKLEQALCDPVVADSLADLGLRFDLTVPLSRVVNAYRDQLKFPWKVFHIGPVWRAERPQKGRFRQFLQCDVDLIGAPGVCAEVEVIQASVHALYSLGARDFELRFNDRRMVQALASKLGLLENQWITFCILLDKREKLSWDHWVQELEQLLGRSVPQEILNLFHEEVKLETVQPWDPTSASSLKELKDLLEALDLPLQRCVFDLSLVRGMGYYTGSVFELRHASAGYAFGGGGRYDQLMGRWKGQDLPACGLSLGFERLLLLLKDEKSQQDSPIVFMPVAEEYQRLFILKTASFLRKQGVLVDVYPKKQVFKKQLQFAAHLGYRWILVFQEGESQTAWKLKDFKTGQEESMAEDQMLSLLKSKGLCG